MPDPANRGPAFAQHGRWPAPAKINLFLHVLGRRDDGYHDLQTLFQFLDWGDEIDIAARDDGAIVCHHRIDGIDDDNDLCARAARLLQARSETPMGADLTLFKRIPTGAGLGGGSSNAATVLCVLNRMWRLNWSTADLCRLALELGADVPVFVQGVAAWAEGVGDKMQPMEPAESWYVLAMPAVHVATAAIFSDADLPRTSVAISPVEYEFESTRNDCEEITCRRYSAVARAREWLNAHAAARMTGTGATVFAPVETRAEARRIANLAPPDLPVQVARGSNESALRLALTTRPW